MKPRCSVFIATSLDGYIAREDGSIDWLERENARVPTGEDCGYGKFIDSIDLLVMGSASFATVLSFPDWPYGERPVWVISRSLASLPASLPASVRLVAAAPADIVTRAGREGYHHLYIDGGALIRSFMAARLIDELTITRVPVLLGSGRPLFGSTPDHVALEHLATRSYSFGFVQSHYRIARD